MSCLPYVWRKTPFSSENHIMEKYIHSVLQGKADISKDCVPSILPGQKLDRQIARHMETVNRKAAILKDRPDNAGLTPYYFSLEGKQPVFICNLIIGSDSRQARTDMACTLKSLRKNHYLFYKGKGKYETPEELFTEVSRNKLTLISDEHFFQYPRNRESVTFVGRIKETAGEFLFRIYDREYFLYLLKRLRTVKRESTRETANIKS